MISINFVSCTLLAILCCASAQVPGEGKCPDPPVQADLQVAEYLGQWYDYAHYEVSFEIGSKCIRADYSIKPNGRIRVINSAVSFTGGNTTVVGEAYAPNPLVGAKLAVSFFNATQTKPNYWVLSTDYTSYSMVYSCTQVTSLLHFQILWFLVRDYNVSDTLKQSVLGKFTSLGLNTEHFIYTKQGPENDCKPAAKEGSGRADELPFFLQRH
eukprot:scpid51055/ scgid27919/ Apolipoprotein D